MSIDGANFFETSYKLYADEHGSQLGYIGSNYYSNNEAFATDFMIQAAAALGVSIQQFTNGMNPSDFPQGAKDPLDIYLGDVGYSG